MEENPTTQEMLDRLRGRLRHIYNLIDDARGRGDQNAIQTLLPLIKNTEDLIENIKEFEDTSQIGGISNVELLSPKEAKQALFELYRDYNANMGSTIPEEMSDLEELRARVRNKKFEQKEKAKKDEARDRLNKPPDGRGIKGGKLSSSDLKGLLDASYDPKVTQVGDFVLDKPLSSSTSKVYRNPDTGQVVVAHRGTAGISDWGNNAVYALGGKSAYKMTARYKEAEKVQKRAEKKYGASNVTTIGHSQGGLQSELLGGKSKEIITLNKATMPFESNKNKNQFDVRSDRDVVSGLNPFAKKSKKDISIKAESYNPLTEHSGDVLNRLDKDKMIGQGVYMKGFGRMEGGRMRPPTPPPPPPSRPIMPPHMFQLQANIAEGERRFTTLRNRLPTTPVGLAPAIQNQMRIILAHLNELQDEFEDGLMEYQERLREYEDITMRRGITMGRGISGSGSFFSKKKEEEKDPAEDLFSMPKNEGDQGFDLNKPKYPVEYHQGLNRDRKTTRYYSKKRIEALSNPKQEVQPAREAQEEKGAKVIAALKPSNPSDSSDWGITERRPTSPKKPLSIEGSFQKMALKSSTSDDELQFGGSGIKKQYIKGNGRMKGGVVGVSPPPSPPPPEDNDDGVLDINSPTALALGMEQDQIDRIGYLLIQVRAMFPNSPEVFSFNQRLRNILLFSPTRAVAYSIIIHLEHILNQGVVFPLRTWQNGYFAMF